jgi:hypothetical protein
MIGNAQTRDDAALLVLLCSHVDAALVEFDESLLTKKWRFHSSDALTARNSRHELVRSLEALAEDPESIYLAELILGEILANTVEHAPGLVEIGIDWREEEPVATVRDTGPGLARFDAALPKDFFDEGGRLRVRPAMERSYACIVRSNGGVCRFSSTPSACRGTLRSLWCRKVRRDASLRRSVVPHPGR